MKRGLAYTVACVLSVQPALAQDSDDSFSLMERGAQQFLEGLLNEMEPAWTEMQGFMEQMGPAMLELLDEIKDWSAYEPPEMLENGDIIIRRKTEVVPDATPEPETAPRPEIEPSPEELSPQIEL